MKQELTAIDGTKQMTPILSHLASKAEQAFRNVSFSPEKRGQSLINDYSAELTEDMEELKAQGVDNETVIEYAKRYEQNLTAWIHAQGNCFSVMITGAGNFPVRRHQKANRSEKRHYEIFREWRTKAKKAIVRKSRPVVTYLTEIDRYKAELEGMKRSHDLMKEGNKIIAKAKKDGTDITEYLTTTFGIKPHMIDWTMKFGFGLQNNNANMKRVEQRIKEMEQKEAKRESGASAKYSFEQGEFMVNYEEDRIQIFFTDRPSKDELTEWKNKGLNTYNWSPSNKCWQRKITSNALNHIKHMISGKITKL